MKGAEQHQKTEANDWRKKRDSRPFRQDPCATFLGAISRKPPLSHLPSEAFHGVRRWLARVALRMPCAPHSLSLPRS